MIKTLIQLTIFALIISGCGSKAGEEKNMNERKPNKLINEKSPYLLQHAYNPVDWYPWGEEAFNKAKREGKPIFLSIGYSTCHWCHVMEHESFEDSTVAAMMNEVFVSIKVDREERPDIDNIYMTVCQMMTGHGGWPMTIIMTPEKKPFFAGTYFPKESKYGRIGLIDLIKRVKEVWQKDKKEIYESADKITDYLKDVTSKSGGTTLDESVIGKAVEKFKQNYDPEFGGFGTAPKFPSPHNLLFLLNFGELKNDKSSLDMVDNTLLNMSLGGIHDHIGGGFHRYSTDRKWILPHFEKMLYDQAMLLLAYTEAYSVTRNELFKEKAENIIEYVLKNMTSPEGGFYSAEDADSEGEEGRFYTWTKQEITEILNKEDATLFFETFNFKEEGNFAEEATKELTGKNIPYLTNQIEEDEGRKLSKKDKISFIKEKLYVEREKRVHPFKDDKILTDWNGLMIASLANAGKAFANEEYIEKAEEAFNFLAKYLIKEENILHRYRDGEAALDGTLDDYAYFIMAALGLYRATFNVDYIDYAIKFADKTDELFLDKKNGGYFLSQANNDDLIIRPKETYDGAMPCGNSIMYGNLKTLYHITANEKYEELAQGVEKVFSTQLGNSPMSSSMFLNYYLDNLFGEYEIVIVEGKNNPREFVQKLNLMRFRGSVIVVKNDNSSLQRLKELIPYISDYETIDGQTTIYLCKNFTCELPTTDYEEVLNKLN